MTAIIGLKGEAGVGKDTVAAHLIDGYGWVRVAFADSLREAALILDPIIEVTGRDGFNKIRLAQYVDLAGWDVAKREAPEVRRLLQYMGDALKHVSGHDILRNVVKEKIADAWLAGAPGVVITDVRNEDDFVKTCGGTLLRIERPNNPHAVTGSNAKHHTELVSRAADLVIVNDGTLDDLVDKVEAFMSIAEYAHQWRAA